MRIAFPDWIPSHEYRGPDYSLHSCRPPRSGFLWGWPGYVPTTPLLDEEIDDFFASLRLSYEVPGRLRTTYKGLWHLPLMKEAETRFAKSFETSIALAFIQYLGTDDLLPEIENFIEGSAELTKVAEPRREAIRNPTKPYGRWGEFADDAYLERYIATKLARVPIQILAEQLMARYILKLHPCEHFDAAECVICGDEFQPESSLLLPLCGAPPVACANCVKVFEGTAYGLMLHGARSPNTLSDHTQISDLMSSALLHYFNEYSYIPATDSQRKNELSKTAFDAADPADFVSKFKRLAIVAPGYAAKMHFRSNALYLDRVGLFEGRSPQGGYRSIASDGHVCLSLGERSICEFLSGLGIPHAKEPRYPEHATLNTNGLYRADFKVGDWLVEFAGRMSVPEYAARMSDKRKLAKVNGLNLLVLEPQDLVELPTKMKHALAQFKNGQTSAG